jgi:hypothetical protein
MQWNTIGSHLAPSVFSLSRKNASEIFLSFDASLKDVLHQRMGFDGSFSTDAESSQGQKLTQLWYASTSL